MKTHTMRNDAAARLESQRALESVHLKTRGLIRQAMDIRERHEAAMTRLADVQGDAPVLAESDSGRRAVAAVLPVVLAAIFVVEWLLAAPTAEWFAISLLGSSSWVPTLTWLLPTSVFLLEVLIAVQISEESERRRDGYGTLRPLLLGVILCLVMPLFSLATQLAIVPEEPELFWMFAARTSGLGAAGGGAPWNRAGERSCDPGESRLVELHARVRVVADPCVVVVAQGSACVECGAGCVYELPCLYTRHGLAWPADTLEFGPWDRAARYRSWARIWT